MQAQRKDAEGSACVGTFLLFTAVTSVTVGPDAAATVALWIGIQQQLLFFAGACFRNSKFNSLRPSSLKAMLKVNLLNPSLFSYLNQHL